MNMMKSDIKEPYKRLKFVSMKSYLPKVGVLTYYFL